MSGEEFVPLSLTPMLIGIANSAAVSRNQYVARGTP